MAEVKWIKLATEIFDNRKIRQLEGLPDGDSILVIWIKLLCLAGNVNDNGMIYLTREVPYTEQMLASQFNRPLNTVQMALKMFESFGMIEIIDNVLKISNWAKYQSIDRMKEIREYNRLAQQKHRQRLAEQSVVSDVSMTCQRRQGTDIEEEKEKENKIKSLEKEGETTTLSVSQPEAACPFGKIQDLYHELCPSFPHLRSIDGERRKAVSARWRQHKSLAVFEELFRIAESSAFLKGQNDRNWHADFDWLMKATNFAKVLEHKYDDRSASGNPASGRESYFSDPSAYENMKPL